MFRKLLARLFGTTTPAAARAQADADRAQADRDARKYVHEWAASHDTHYPGHGRTIWGPHLTTDGTAYEVGCSHRDHGRNEPIHTEPIGD